MMPAIQALTIKKFDPGTFGRVCICLKVLAILDMVYILCAGGSKGAGEYADEKKVFKHDEFGYVH